MNTRQLQILNSGLEEIFPNGVLGDSAKLIEKLKLYFDELLLWNPKLGLIEADEDEIIIRHLLDSATAAPYFQEIIENLMNRGQEHIHLADVGSGAGLPGIVLALLFVDSLPISISLIEKQQRRCGFLRNVVPLLGLSDCITIENSLMEDIPQKYHIVTSRAFSALDDQGLAKQLAMVVPGGCIAAYKGRRAVIEKELAGKEADIRKIRYSFLRGESHLVVIEKKLN